MYYPKVVDFILAFVFAVILVILLFTYQLFADMWYFLASVPVVVLVCQGYVWISQKYALDKSTKEELKIGWKKNVPMTFSLLVWILAFFFIGRAKTGLIFVELHKSDILFMGAAFIFGFIYFLWAIVVIKDILVEKCFI